MLFQNLLFYFISEPPGPPINPRVTDMLHDRCALSWQPPASNGGAEVTGYQIERRLASSSRWVSACKQTITDLQTTVCDLVESNEYEFRVIAENKIGQGQPSEATQPQMCKDPWGELMSPN